LGEIERIKRLVTYYKRLCNTSDPFEIADRLGILYQIGNLNQEGCYMFLKNHRYIFLSNQLSREELILVMAHELGHALLDVAFRVKCKNFSHKLQKRAFKRYFIPS